jgi:hypothetical protein
MLYGTAESNMLEKRISPSLRGTIYGTELNFTPLLPQRKRYCVSSFL